MNPKQGHDRRASRLWKSFFDSQPEAERRSERKVTSLDRIDWDRFTSQRRSGEVSGWPNHVKNLEYIANKEEIQSALESIIEDAHDIRDEQHLAEVFEMASQPRETLTRIFVRQLHE